SDSSGKVILCDHYRRGIPLAPHTKEQNRMSKQKENTRRHKPQAETTQPLDFTHQKAYNNER
ncbi:MAG: hypothetical protein IKG91_06920, partial [Firmicutes bacterium]|nr:hypothetical protein [Bacillota bacterium]